MFSKISNPEKLKEYLNTLRDDLDTAEETLATKTQVDDTSTGSVDSTYSANKIESSLAEKITFLGSYTTANRPRTLTSSDLGKYMIYDSTTQGFLFWMGNKWSDE